MKLTGSQPSLVSLNSGAIEEVINEEPIELVFCYLPGKDAVAINWSWTVGFPSSE